MTPELAAVIGRWFFVANLYRPAPMSVVRRCGPSGATFTLVPARSRARTERRRAKQIGVCLRWWYKPNSKDKPK